MMTISAIWLLISGYWAVDNGRYLWASVATYRTKGLKPLAKSYAGRNLFSASILTVTYLAYFVIGVVGLFAESPATVWVLIVGAATTPYAAKLNSKRFVSSLEEIGEVPPYATYSMISVVAAVGIVALWIAGTSTPTPAPFTYDSWELVETEYCPGDNLLIAFTGTAEGRGGYTRINGELLMVDYGITGAIQYEVADTWQRTTDYNEPSGRQRFDELPPFSQYTIPSDTPAGEYAWRHSNVEVDGFGDEVSETDGFTTEPFEVKDCSQ